MKTTRSTLALETNKLFQLFSKTKRMFLIIIISFLYSALSLNAQNAKELGKTLTGLKTSSKIAENTEASRLKSLVYDLQSTVYIQEGKMKTFDKNSPVCADVDAQSISTLYLSDTLFNNVELITVRLNNINDLSKALDMAKLTSFNNLKYVLFLCTFKCDAEYISKQYLPDTKAGVSVVYLVSIPE